MTAPITILFGGNTDGRDDFKSLQKSAAGSGKTRWSALKSTRKGDRILIYCRKPHGALVAAAEALEDAKRGSYWNYETRLCKIRLIEPPFTREEIQQMFPTWRWAKSTRGQAAVPQEIAELLWQRATGTSALAAPRPSAAKGAGFGNAETNALVETAAVERVKRELEKRGYTVTSREAQQIGYDLDAVKGRMVLHVEVKGITGAVLQFPITAGEVRQAHDDPAFQLFAVTGALTKGAKLHEFTGAEFIKQFTLAPLTYLAKTK